MENEQAASVETASLTFEEKVLQTIVGVALASIDGLISADGKFFSSMTEDLADQSNVTSGIEVEVGKEQVAIDLEVIVAYGKDIPRLFAQIQEIVLQEVSRLTALEVKEINIRIVDVVKQETIEKTTDNQ
ncbi:Asp23/Gls24 family envelope stress response protein [Enterococcus gallinarum]|uniref:Stress response regulator gls24 homolog n=1 Tax=Enterococcus gallinarum TaxID=1353 RepID=A0ABD4ZPH9_ENTGA|nr:Asp23/Gls24 family envelope stress response protein [Enterococcus gallinarum]MBF0820511.1 Asp23/Gls24 family envelope stress response protein [Enterococcus faecalis]MBF0725937.1 Asp23/Gls24 family envelope stress response protein [Enterococcus gallinarum]MBF0797741.1 Asp23/Gls24 family envelope stress response protein [Enterococcus gallinarum]MBX8977239.1 Asp23/Gls24 family envelope stress response protein [Enterococcus gallinarum]MDL4873444.1 Asp23/Gls24 family envelope stress response pro